MSSATLDSSRQTALPLELVDHVLEQLARRDLQHVTVRVMQAQPRSVSLNLLWRHVRLTREQQAWQCISHLDKLSLRPLQHTRTLDVNVWRDDPQMLVNLARLPPNAWSINLSIGPLWSPEHLQELLNQPRWIASVEQLTLRFNPYVTQRSYYTFLKGTFFDSCPILLTTWTTQQAPNLHRLAFQQDLPPNYGTERKSIPAFGLHRLSLEQDENKQESTRQEISTLDFAQPIVFHRLTWLDMLGHSNIGQQLTHLSLRLPRRNLVSCLSSSSSSSSSSSNSTRPFKSLIHLDLSTTHVQSQSISFSIMLRLFPQLKSLTLDHCTGLISLKEPLNGTSLNSFEWLGKCIGGQGNFRMEFVNREWYKISRIRHSTTRQHRDRTTTTTTPSSITNENKHDHVVMVRDLLILPALPSLVKLGIGLLNHNQSQDQETQNHVLEIETIWKQEFKKGYQDSIKKIILKIKDHLKRFQLWLNQSKGLNQGTRQLMIFKDTYKQILKIQKPFLNTIHHQEELNQEIQRLQIEFNEMNSLDLEFKKFSNEFELLPLNSIQSIEILLNLFETKLIEIQDQDSEEQQQEEDQFNLCFVPDCSNKPGVAHLSLSNIVAGTRTSIPKIESIQQRQERERDYERQERQDRLDWRRSNHEHERSNCSHIEQRRSWYEED
ncbi:hypothetical protein OIO90_002365 [Microbotryomycetes sp. JL221]|nr:hypothetical protein OIO90_002365 [Microbotryomycetes sp. JL221]